MAGKYPNSGILSRNKRRDSDKHPEYTGSAEIDGQEYWLSAWVNENDQGKYFKISFKKKEASHGGGQSQRSSGRSQQHEDDDAPF